MSQPSAKTLRPQIAPGASRLLEELCYQFLRALLRELDRIKPGYFHPPLERPIFVPGFPWLSILILGPKGPPQLAHLAFWRSAKVGRNGNLVGHAGERGVCPSPGCAIAR